MAAVYTTLLGTLAGGGSSVIGPWPGARVVVKDIEWTNYSSDGSTSYAYDTATELPFAVVEWPDDGAVRSSQWTGTLVLTDGAQLSITASYEAGATVSGYLLGLP
jgi:hypothetical protein